MLSEIGSNFWEYSVGNNASEAAFFWMNSKYEKQYYKSGRNAIKALCRNLIQCPKRVILPIYTCETVIQPFIDEGWEVSFYQINKNLTINEQSIFWLLEEKKPSVVFVHSYFGFNTLEDESCLQYCKRAGAIIVEDMTQSLFSKHYVKCADYYVSSFRKFLAIPDGGVLISASHLKKIPAEDADSQIARVAMDAFDMKADYFKSEAPEVKEAFRAKYQELNRLIGDNRFIQNISPISLSILFSCNMNAITTARRSNYLYVYNEMQTIESLIPVVNFPVDECAPLYLPVYTDNRSDLQRFMAENSIYCPVIWPKPLQIACEDADTQYMYEHMLCIPIDQRYGNDEMKKIVESMRQFDISMGK